jgi:ComF family protein
MKWRGYNQSALLAQGMGKKLSVDVLDCLKRIKKTQTQVGLSQAKRLENMKDAFVLKKSFTAEKYEQVFLVDDVVTSGATLREAAKVFKKAGVEKVWGITLAHGN